MKQLFIVRHAEAEQGKVQQPDFERALTSEGRQDALDLGRYLKVQNLAPQKILVSSAKRTLETFLQINLSLQTTYEERKDVYNASFEELRALIAFTDDDIHSLMIVGHNPGVHALALYFSKTSEEPREFPPTSLLILNFDVAWNKFQRHGGGRQIFRMP
jgi:phosphohistidine phosphatase